MWLQPVLLSVLPGLGVALQSGPVSAHAQSLKETLSVHSTPRRQVTRELRPHLCCHLCPQRVQAHPGRVHHRPRGPHAADDQGPSQQPGEAGVGGAGPPRSPHPGRGWRGGAPGCGSVSWAWPHLEGKAQPSPFLAGDVLGVPGLRRQLRQGECCGASPAPGSLPPGADQGLTSTA